MCDRTTYIWTDQISPVLCHECSPHDIGSFSFFYNLHFVLRLIIRGSWWCSTFILRRKFIDARFFSPKQFSQTVNAWTAGDAQRTAWRPQLSRLISTLIEAGDIRSGLRLTISSTTQGAWIKETPSRWARALITQFEFLRGGAIGDTTEGKHIDGHLCV